MSNKCLPAECCGEYVESVFFQVLALTGTNGQMIFENPREGLIEEFTYFFDSSQDENVTSSFEVNTKNNQGSLINFPTNSNTQFVGTNTTCKIEFKVQMQFNYRDRLIFTWDNSSLSDCTIMAIANIRYKMGV